MKILTTRKTAIKNTFGTEMKNGGYQGPGEEGMGSYFLMGTEFNFARWKEAWRRARVMAASSVSALNAATLHARRPRC